MTLRARDLAEMERRAILDLAEREQDLATLTRRTQDVLDDYKRQVHTLTFQSELATRTWQEVEMTKFKETLATYQSEYKARTEDFCADNLQKLNINLGSYAEHARSIQEKLLLVRMRKDIQQTYADTHRGASKPNTTPIPVDDMQTPERDRKTPRDTMTVPVQKSENDRHPSFTIASVSAHQPEASTTDR